MTQPGLPKESPPPERRSEERWLGAVLLLMAGIAAWMLTSSWHASILDRYEFRQLQTALSIFWMKQEGLRLDYLTPLFGPPWTIPMEFPIYQWCVTLLTNLTGMELEQAGRLTGILFYAAMLPAVYGLLDIVGLPRARRWLVLAVVLGTPVYLFYPRTVMIESTALCFSVWFLYALHRTLTKNHWGWFAAACLLGLLAALTKITTFAIYAVPAAALTLAAIRRAGWREGKFRPAETMRPALLAAVPVALALGATLWWIARSDVIKHSNPFTGFLASTELQRWNYGGLGLRFEASFWMQLVKNITENVLSEGALALGVLCATFASPAARRVALVCLAGFFAGPLVFANLYHVHDYYYSANALLLTGAVGLLLASAWDNPRLTAGSRWALLLVVLILQYRAFDRSYHYYYWKEAPPPPEIATIVRETTPADGVLLVYGWDWNPLLPYYAQRRAIMVPDRRDDDLDVLETILQQLPPRRVTALLIRRDPTRPHHPEFIRQRIARFLLSPIPFATSEDGELYLTEDNITTAAKRMGGRTFGKVTLNLEPPARPDEDQLPVNDLSGLEFPMTSPRPTGARSRFGISLGTDENQRPIINAHPDSELSFTPPPGATRIRAEFGLAEAAYRPGAPAVTDGVTVEILEVLPNGFRRLLFRRNLNPATVPGDRGLQGITLDPAGPFSGTLVFKITPGPNNNYVNDWAHWGRIEIR
jgi:hypothetical protein